MMVIIRRMKQYSLIKNTSYGGVILLFFACFSLIFSAYADTDERMGIPITSTAILQNAGFENGVEIFEMSCIIENAIEEYYLAAVIVDVNNEGNDKRVYNVSDLVNNKMSTYEFEEGFDVKLECMVFVENKPVSYDVAILQSIQK